MNGDETVKRQAPESEAILETLAQLRETRLREGVSLRSLAKRMKCSVSHVRAQENGLREVSVSDLYRWQQALKVPMTELLGGPMRDLNEPIRQRAGLVRAAKTAHFLVKKCTPGQEQREATRLVDELCELMPELREVSAWPERRPRPVADFGRAADEISIQEWALPTE